MTDVKETVRKVIFGDRWRSWVGVGFFGICGVVFCGLALSESKWNSDIWAAFVMGVMSIGFGAYFLWRTLQLPKIAARIGDLLEQNPREVTWIYEQVIPLRRGKVWNVFVWTSGSEKVRLAVYREPVRDQLWAALQSVAPHAFAPYSKARERELKAAA